MTPVEQIIAEVRDLRDRVIRLEERLRPIEKLMYGVVVLTLTTVFLAVLALVVRK